MDQFEGVPAFLQPRLRLFMSVDLVGSTALKQGKFPIEAPESDTTLSQVGSHWLPDLVTFYRDIDSKFRGQWARYCTEIANANGWPQGGCARLWKINGDELIYVDELRSSRHAVALLWNWLQACKAFRADLSAKNSKLDVKMTAWTAGFPISNTEVIFDQQKTEEYADWDPLTLHYSLTERWYSDPTARSSLVQDFIGPTIDTGFRLSGKSTPRKFVISLEVAYILAMTANPSAMPLKIGYDGMAELKGVLGGKPYPVFWVDAHGDDPLSRAEDDLRGPPHPQFGSIRAFCDEYISSKKNFMLKPFICRDDEPLLAEIPKHYHDKLLQIANAWDNAKNNRKAYLDSSLDSSSESPISMDGNLPDVRVPAIRAAKQSLEEEAKPTPEGETSA